MIRIRLESQLLTIGASYREQPSVPGSEWAWHLVWHRAWVKEGPTGLWKSRSLDHAFESHGLGVVTGLYESIAELLTHESPRE